MPRISNAVSQNKMPDPRPADGMYHKLMSRVLQMPPRLNMRQERTRERGSSSKCGGEHSYRFCQLDDEKEDWFETACCGIERQRRNRSKSPAPHLRPPFTAPPTSRNCTLVSSPKESHLSHHGRCREPHSDSSTLEPPLPTPPLHGRRVPIANCAPSTTFCIYPRTSVIRASSCSILSSHTNAEAGNQPKFTALCPRLALSR